VPVCRHQYTCVSTVKSRRRLWNHITSGLQFYTEKLTYMKRVLTILSISIIICSCSTDKHADSVSGVIRRELFNASMRPGVACYRIPSLITAPNGDLVAAVDERAGSCSDLNTNKDINIVVRRSSDNGLSWSDIETAADFPPGISASDPSMIADRITGDIFLFYNVMDHHEHPGIYYLYVVKSSDNGRSWSNPRDITTQISKPGWREDVKFITSGRGIQTCTGTLLHTMVNLNHGMHLFGSKDHGKNWFLLDTPIEPADESKIVELADSTWLINSRNSNGGMRYVHISGDTGKTWTSKPEPALIDPGCNASIIRCTSAARGHDTNRLLFSNVKATDQRKNMTVRISYDEGETWTRGKTIYEGSSAYSSMTILGNGEIGLLYEQDNYSKNIFVRFSLEWLTDGKDTYEPPGIN